MFFNEMYMEIETQINFSEPHGYEYIKSLMALAAEYLNMEIVTKNKVEHSYNLSKGSSDCSASFVGEIITVHRKSILREIFGSKPTKKTEVLSVVFDGDVSKPGMMYEKLLVLKSEFAEDREVREYITTLSKAYF